MTRATGEAYSGSQRARLVPRADEGGLELEGFGKSSEQIDRIRTLYREQFDQQSVLRVDDPYVVWVSLLKNVRSRLVY
jgi:hypothetical protein